MMLNRLKLINYKERSLICPFEFFTFRATVAVVVKGALNSREIVQSERVWLRLAWP